MKCQIQGQDQYRALTVLLPVVLISGLLSAFLLRSAGACPVSCVLVLCWQVTRSTAQEALALESWSKV